MKILYLNNYDSSFIQNQLVELKEIGDIQPFLIIHMSYWEFYRLKGCDKSKIFSNQQVTSLNEEAMKFVSYFGLPKDLLIQLHPKFLSKRILSEFKKGDFDLIHAMNGFPSGATAMILAKKWSIPYIITSHGMDINRCLPNSLELIGVRPFHEKAIKLFKKASKSAFAFVSVSKAFGELIKEAIPEITPVIIQNSYKHQIFKITNKQFCRQKYGIKEETFVIIFVGNFISSKRHIDAITSLKCIKEEKIELYLIGGGGDRIEFLRSEITKMNLTLKVKIMQNIKQDALVEYYNLADITVFPSLKDSFGLSLVEAMACGCPAISTRTYGPVEIIDEDVTGFFVDYKAPKQIAEKINYFINNKEQIEIMGKKASTSVYERYARKNSELLELYHNALSRK